MRATINFSVSCIVIADDQWNPACADIFDADANGRHSRSTAYCSLAVPIYVDERCKGFLTMSRVVKGKVETAVQYFRSSELAYAYLFFGSVSATLPGLDAGVW